MYWLSNVLERHAWGVEEDFFIIIFFVIIIVIIMFGVSVSYMCRSHVKASLDGVKCLKKWSESSGFLWKFEYFFEPAINVQYGFYDSHE